MKKYLATIIKGESLGENDMYSLMSRLMAGEFTDAQIGAFIGALSVRGETGSELAGAARAMREKALLIEPGITGFVDTCGTGGDCTNTFNISTAAAFVTAGCGVPVAKHGNRSVSSRCGSADVLEALGVAIDITPAKAAEALEKIGICFLFAPYYHEALKYAARARREIGVRSIFNMLGPLTNPGRADRQIIGVFSGRLTEMFAEALLTLGSEKALVVHGNDGLDEISVCAPTRITELCSGTIKTYELLPEKFFGKRYPMELLRGGSADENALFIRKVLSGVRGARRDVVVINCAGALVAAGAAAGFEEGVAMAEESIDSGKAMEKLNKLVEFTKS